MLTLITKSDGIIPASELTDDPTLTPSDVVKVGDVIDVFVIRVNDAEGKRSSFPRRRSITRRNTLFLQKLLENGTVLSGIVIEAVKGGVIVLCEGIRVFVPGSQGERQILKRLIRAC